MKKLFPGIAIAILSYLPAYSQNDSYPAIEVTGSATLYIVPDRITIEIGMEEYYEHHAKGDSTIVKLPGIEKKVRQTLKAAGVADSLITVTDMGNYRNRHISDQLLMAKRISAIVTDFDKVEKIADSLDRDGITNFNITKIDNSDISSYNRRGLKSALDAARSKAEFIAGNEGLTILMPYEIVENGPNYYETPAFSNVAYDAGSGMENMRRIVRRYSVKVRYLFKEAPAS